MTDSDTINNPADKRKLDIADPERLRYLGFDVGPSEIGELFKTKDEERKYVDHVIDKRDHNDVLRDTSNFREERISATERYIVFGASLMIMISLFLPFTPWVSGYVQTETEVTVSDVPAPADITADITTDGQPDADVTAGAADATGATGAADGTDTTVTPDAAGASSDAVDAIDAIDGDETGASSTDDSETDDAIPSAAALSRQGVVGFQDLQVSRKKTKIVRTPYSWSGVQILVSLGSTGSKIFSSGVILIVSGILFLVYMLLSLAIPGYIGYCVMTIKGHPDEVALKLKSILKLAWIPVLVWVAILVLSVIGADYGFDTTDALEQVGESYGIGAFLGLLGAGFYLSLAGFVLAGSKSVEI